MKQASHHHAGRPPAILLGGNAIALAVARSLGSQGIRTIALDYPTSTVRHSRYAEWVDLPYGNDLIGPAMEWLLGAGRAAWKGAIILPCWDDGLELIARHRRALEGDYGIIEANDEVLLAVMDKRATRRLAERAGVAAPAIWAAGSLAELQRVLGEIRYPCALKPQHSHVFHRSFPYQKLIIVRNEAELLERFAEFLRYDLQMLVTELIPQTSEGYLSYYSYLDERGEPLFHFTKRKLRQYPNAFGLGTYHVTEWHRDVAELGLRFFQRIGLRGVGNVEFMRDPRDGALKLIECNARFTLTTEHLRLSGIDLPLFAYNAVAGLPLPNMNLYREHVYLIRPGSDLKAFLELRRSGRMTLPVYLKSLMHPQHNLYFKWRDPLPALALARTAVGRRLRSLSAWLLPRTLRHLLADAKAISA